LVLLDASRFGASYRVTGTQPFGALSRGPQAARRHLHVVSAFTHGSLPTAFDLASELGTLPVATASWESFLKHMCLDPQFQQNWGRKPVKFEAGFDLAKGAFDMEDVKLAVPYMPGQFTAHGVEAQGGIYNQPFPEDFDFSQLESTMRDSTVVLLNAGFCVPEVAAVAQAALQATQLPIWLNIYLTTPGLVRSTQLHTDKQDVILVQTTGRKRWRVYAPPAPSASPWLDPFARGKGTDAMEAREEDLLVDTVMKPGDVMYIPAAFPHVTDTVNVASSSASDSDSEEEDEEASVHLTIGVDTHLWGLNYATMREVALRRKKQTALINGNQNLNTLAPEAWGRLHESLPLGFLAAPVLSQALQDAAAAGSAAGSAGSAVGKLPRPSQRRAAVSEPLLVRAMALGCAARMRSAEPGRWANPATGGSSDEDDAALAKELDLEAVASEMLRHYRRVLRVQQRIHVDTSAGPHLDPVGGGGAGSSFEPRGRATLERIGPLMDELDAAMDQVNGKLPAADATAGAGGGGLAGNKAGAKSKEPAGAASKGGFSSAKKKAAKGGRKRK